MHEGGRKNGRGFTLYKVGRDGTMEEVARPESFEEGWGEGQHKTHTEPESAFSLYRGKRRIARFCHHRLTSNDATANLDAMVL